MPASATNAASARHAGSARHSGARGPSFDGYGQVDLNISYGGKKSPAGGKAKVAVGSAHGVFQLSFS